MYSNPLQKVDKNSQWQLSTECGRSLIGVVGLELGQEERRTRRHGVTLANRQCRLDIRTFSFSQRTVNEWSRLSADCVGASSVNIFKNKIDICIKHAGYT